jgi:hypothetical protein
LLFNYYYISTEILSYLITPFFTPAIREPNPYKWWDSKYDLEKKKKTVEDEKG